MSRPDCGWRVRRLSLRYPCRDAHGSVFDPLSAGHPSLLRWAVPSCPRCLLPPSPENPACPLWQVGFLRWCELRSRLLRPRDLQAGTPRKPLRTKSVTHVSGINRNPCVRYGPRSGWLGRQDSNLGMAESKSKWFALSINGHSEKSQKFGPKPTNRLAVISECRRRSHLRLCCLARGLSALAGSSHHGK